MFGKKKDKKKQDEKDEKIMANNVKTTVTTTVFQRGTSREVHTTTKSYFSSSSSNIDNLSLGSNSSLLKILESSNAQFDATPFKRANPTYQSLPPLQRKTSLPTFSVTQSTGKNINLNYKSPYTSQINTDAVGFTPRTAFLTTSPSGYQSYLTPTNRRQTSTSSIGNIPRTPTTPTSRFTPAFSRPTVSTSTVTQGKTKPITTPVTRTVEPRFLGPPIRRLNLEEVLRDKLKVKVVKSTKFHDDPESKVPMYVIRSKNRGHVLVINNMKFVDSKSDRKGAELDEQNSIELFKQMGFKITKYRDLTIADMQNKIKDFRRNSSLKNVDICAVVVMSHGYGNARSDSTLVIGTDGNQLETSWIMEQFDGENCSYMTNKPKIFIFQCCRGDNKDTSNIKTDSSIMKPPIRKMADMLVAYSTVPGFVSHRDEKQGTWYIQAVCKIFAEHAHDTDVESLLKMVDHELSHLVTGSGSKQTTSFENRSFKTCYIHPQYYG